MLQRKPFGVFASKRPSVENQKKKKNWLLFTKIEEGKFVHTFKTPSHQNFAKLSDDLYKEENKNCQKILDNKLA